MSIIDINHTKEDKTMSNQLTTNVTNGLSLNDINQLRDEVIKGLSLVNKGYLAITPQVTKLYDFKAWESLGYANFDKLCENEFGMSHGTTVNIRKVFARFGSKNSETGAYSIPQKYEEFGFTKLLLFANDAKRFESAGINPIEEFTPDMTIKDMKAKLAGLLEDKAEKQESEAVDTTAKEVTTTTTTTSTSDVPFEDTANMKPAELVKSIIDSVNLLSSKAALKPEKMALLDAILANLKEIEKAINAKPQAEIKEPTKQEPTKQEPTKQEPTKQEQKSGIFGRR